MRHLVLAIVLVASPAYADLSKPKDSKAQKHLLQGIKFYDLAEFDKAIEEFKAGVMVEDAPVLLYNLGQAHRKLGKYEKAIWYYERYLGRGNVKPNVEMYVADFIKVMKAELEQAARSAPPSDPEPTTKRKPQEPPQLTVVSAPPLRWYHDRRAWGVAGGGLVLGIVGGGFLLDAAGLQDQADRESSQTERDRLTAKAKSRRTIGTVLTSAGVAIVLAGVVKLAIVPRGKDAPERAPEPTITLRFGLTWIGLQGRF